MFSQMQVIKSINHFHVIQILFELHKSFNVLYCKLKHKLTILIRSKLIKLRFINDHDKHHNASFNNYQEQFCRHLPKGAQINSLSRNQVVQEAAKKSEFLGYNESTINYNYNNNNHFITDLSQLMLAQLGAYSSGNVASNSSINCPSDQTTQSSISIPMQLLLLPLVVPQANLHKTESFDNNTCPQNKQFNGLSGNQDKQAWQVNGSNGLTMRNPLLESYRNNHINNHNGYFTHHSYDKNSKCY